MAINYLCEIRRARHPFFIESIGINIYSAEELCYYLQQYVYLIDETLINERLCDWIREELDLNKAANDMKHALVSKEGTAAFFTPFLRECRYLSDEETKAVLEQITGMEVETEDKRRKQKADQLLRFKLFRNAITEYEKLLEKRHEGRIDRLFYADVQDHLAASYAHLFQFEDAAEHLWQSYELTKSRQTLEKYLKLLPLFLSENRYGQRIEEIGIKPSVAQECREEAEQLLLEGLERGKEQGQTKEDRSLLLKALKDDYIHNTAGVR